MRIVSSGSEGVPDRRVDGTYRHLSATPDHGVTPTCSSRMDQWTQSGAGCCSCGQSDPQAGRAGPPLLVPTDPPEVVSAPDHRVRGVHRPGPTGTFGAPASDKHCTVIVSNDERVLTRRTLYLVSSILGLGAVLSACSSSAQQTPSPQSACSLLTTQEASAAFAAPVQPSHECQGLPGNQSDALYTSGGKPGVLIVHVNWGKVAVNTFTVSHSGHAQYVAGDAPPAYSRMTVSGIPAYWQPTVSISGTYHAQTQILSALKNGYVVTLISMSLSQSQDEHVLASIISHL